MPDPAILVGKLRKKLKPRRVLSPGNNYFIIVANLTHFFIGNQIIL
jgi:hypothetical protein